MSQDESNVVGAGYSPPGLPMLLGVLLLWAGLGLVEFIRGIALEPGTEPAWFASAIQVMFFSIAPFSAYCAITCARHWCSTGNGYSAAGWFVSSASFGVVGFICLRHYFPHMPTAVDVPFWCFLILVFLIIGRQAAGGTK